MKFLAYLFVLFVVAFVFYAALSLVRFAFVRIKAYMIRRKLAKVADTEKKDD